MSLFNGFRTMIALQERKQQLYQLIGVTAVTVAVGALLAIHLPGDVSINYPALYALVALTVGSGVVLLLTPGWLSSRPYLFWPIAGVLFPCFEAVAVYYTGGVRSPFFVLFYFSLFFIGMVGDHRGAIGGSLVVGIAYIVASLLHDSPAGTPSLMRFMVTLGSFYGIAFFAAYLGNIAWQEARDANRRGLRLAGLNAVNANLSGTLDTEALLQAIPRELCRQLGFERALLYTMHGDRLCLASGYSNAEPEHLENLIGYLREHPQTLGSNSVEAEVARTLRPATSLDPAHDPRVNPKVLGIAQSCSFAAAPLLAKGELLGVVVADYFRKDHDITEEEMILLSTFASMAALAMVNNRLVIEAGQAEAFRQLDVLKTDFLATVSHELRTPLTLVRSSVDLLREDVSEGLSPVQRRLLETVARNGERLTALVEEILEMAQLEEGRVVLNRQITDLRYLVDEVAQTLNMLVGDRRQTLYLDLAEEPCLVECDRHRMQHIVTNLITNACKYTPRGGHVWVSVRCDDDQVALEVRDDGPGIPSDKLEHIWDKFYRLPGAEKHAKGTGLGLAIARSLVELHGSEISVSSCEGEGSVFWFSLPRVVMRDGAAETQEARVAEVER